MVPEGGGADPFLNAVGTGFVVGLVAVYIIGDVCSGLRPIVIVDLENLYCQTPEYKQKSLIQRVAAFLF